jgi:hypothetical protein
MFQKKNSFILFAVVSSLMLGCSSSENTTAKPSSIIGQFNTAMTSAGTQLQSSSLANSLVKNPSRIHAISDVDDICDENGNPIVDGEFMDQGDAEFPARVFYCKVVKDTGSPESIQGAYGQTKSIACALENAGIVYDGVEHTATVNINSDCFSPSELSDDEMPSSLDITYVASQPAAFNPNFQSGVVMTIEDFGTFTLAASSEGSVIKFMGYENQGSTKTGVFVGQFDNESGEIRFEGRHDRYNCVEEGGSCGWTKHDRIYLKCGSINDKGECEDIESVEGASSDVFNENNSGRIVTISGDFSEGVRTRYYYTDSDDFNDPEVWTESMTAADQCYTLDSPTGGECSENPGIEIPGETFFFTMVDGFTPNREWYRDVEELSFTRVSLLDDIP